MPREFHDETATPLGYPLVWCGMMDPRSCAEWMSGLLQHFNLPLRAETEQDVCTLHFDGKPSVHLISSVPDGYVNVMCEAGLVPNLQAADTLLGLLMLNRCDSAEYTVGVTVHHQSGTVIVCSRQRWAALDPAATRRLLQCVHAKVEAVQRTLGKPDIRPQAKADVTKSRTLLARYSAR